LPPDRTLTTAQFREQLRDAQAQGHARLRRERVRCGPADGPAQAVREEPQAVPPHVRRPRRPPMPHSADDICRMGNYIVEPEEAGPYYAELFGMVADGALKLEIHGEYAFDAAGCIQAQKDLTGGKTIGKLLLKV
jgi:hypothetical protein